MFLFNFKIRPNITNILEPIKNIHITKKDSSYTITSDNKNTIDDIKKQIQCVETNNIFDSLVDDSIIIYPVHIEMNNTEFDLAYKYVYDNFQRELLSKLESELLNLYDNNILILPVEIPLPYKYDIKLQKKIPIQFRKDVFLKTYDFIQELNEKAKAFNKKIVFEQLYKYIWKKNVTDLKDHNK